jgi:hypothetical protein
MEDRENPGRTRMNIGLTAKGAAQWDITAEYATPEEAAVCLSAGIDRIKQIIKEKGLSEVGAI